MLLFACFGVWYRRKERIARLDCRKEADALELSDIRVDDGDDTPSADLRRYADTQTAVEAGMSLAQALLVAGSALPLVGQLCEACRGILGSAGEFSEKADDVLVAAERVIDVLRTVHLMAKNVDRLAHLILYFIPPFVIPFV